MPSHLSPTVPPPYFAYLRQALWLSLLVLLALGNVSCKARKEAKARKQLTEQTKADLTALLNDTELSATERTRRLDEIKGRDINDDPEVKSLIARVEQQILTARQREEAEAQAREEARAREARRTRYTEVSDVFGQVAQARDVGTANAAIGRAMQLFASPNVPVLVIIHEANGQKDYDRPTTILDYLNYLKDQRSNPNAVKNLVFDANGKITEVELIKN